MECFAQDAPSCVLNVCSDAPVLPRKAFLVTLTSIVALAANELRLRPGPVRFACGLARARSALEIVGVLETRPGKQHPHVSR